MNKLVLLLCAVLSSTAGISAAASDVKEEQEVKAAFEALVKAYNTKDVATVSRLCHEDLSYGHSTGQLWTKADVVKDVQARFWSVKVVEANIRVSGPVAVIRSIIDYRNGTTAQMDNVQPGVRVLWVFVKGPQGWQVIARQALRLHA